MTRLLVPLRYFCLFLLICAVNGVAQELPRPLALDSRIVAGISM
jgi:hypothetical protein